jgi:23S rRNA U2552 (ribose-2'-O)-methylase RlmE/FtsJ
MKVRIVPRSKVRVSRKSKSKYDKIKDAIEHLKPGGEALRVKYSDKKELNSIRNIAYAFNKEHGTKIKSSSNPSENIIFFYIEG